MVGTWQVTHYATEVRVGPYTFDPAEFVCRWCDAGPEHQQHVAHQRLVNRDTMMVGTECDECGTPANHTAPLITSDRAPSMDDPRPNLEL